MRETSGSITDENSSMAARYGLLLVLILAALVRGYACTEMACISRDGVQFVTYAKRLATEPIAALRDTTKQPGMPLLLLAVNRIAINPVYQEHPLIWQACGQFVAFCGGVVSCVLIMLLARRLFRDERLALLAGLIACVWPQGVLLSADVLSDMPHLALYLGALLVGHAAIEKVRIRRLALCGALAGLAYLLRQEALGVVAAVMIGWFWCLKSRSMARRVVGAAVLLLTFAVVVAPYPIAVGRVMPNKTIGELFIGPRADGAADSPADSPFHAEHSLALRGEGEPSLAHLVPWYQAPARMVEEWCKSGRYVLSTLVLIALFLKSCPRAERTGMRLVVLAVVLQVVAVQLRVKSYGEISSRYLLIPAALCIPWASTGMTTLVRLIAARLSLASMAEAARTAELAGNYAAPAPFEVVERRRVWSLWLSASILVFAPLAYYAVQPISADKASYKLAGRWLRHHTDKADRILAHDRLEQIMFYAGRAWPVETWLPYEADGENADQMERLLAANRPDLFLDARSSRRDQTSKDAGYWDALESLAGYELVWTSGDGPHETRIYRRTTRVD